MPLIRIRDHWRHYPGCAVRTPKQWLHERHDGNTTVYDYECDPCDCEHGWPARLALILVVAAMAFLAGALI